MYVLELAGQDDAFAVREAESAASDVTALAPGLATARGLSERAPDLAYTHRASELVATCDPDVASARGALDAAAVDRAGTVAVRAVDVRSTTGVDTQRVERELGSALVDRGFEVDLDDPDHELRALFAAGDAPAAGAGAAEEVRDASDVPADADGVCALGWLAVETRRDFAPAPTERPFFQPGSMDPMEARALVNVAGARDGRRVVDPMCGTGGILVEAGLVGASVVGTDAQWKMVRGSRENLAEYVDDFHVARADATALPLRDGAADAVVFDAPYGRQSRIEGDLADVVAGALAEAHRVAPRGVLVADRDWTEAAEAAGWTVESRFERRVHRSLVRHVHVLR
ncbi:methyltransferase domain-containing protein [Halomicrobium salinisoli]|uniref:methyltransferase domain-containing protein n=1 Tax=Halomicrobium salinisoli TaxID=2878391 RepID=UPI001CF01AC3|nr:methyltransferase domain-containing protein [Halomicrobium salinisoli]